MKTEAECLREKCIKLEARELGFIQSLRELEEAAVLVHSSAEHWEDLAVELEAENAQSRDHIIEQERGICGRERRIAELEAQLAWQQERDTRAQLELQYLVTENKELREALEKITRTYGSAGAIAIARTALVETDHDDLWESWLGDAND